MEIGQLSDMINVGLANHSNFYHQMNQSEKEYTNLSMRVTVAMEIGQR